MLYLNIQNVVKQDTQGKNSGTNCRWLSRAAATAAKYGYSHSRSRNGLEGTWVSLCLCCLKTKVEILPVLYWPITDHVVNGWITSLGANTEPLTVTGWNFQLLLLHFFNLFFLIRFASNQSGKSIAHNESTGSSAQSSMSSLVRFRTSFIEIHMALKLDIL